MVERLLAKQKVVGSNPIARSDQIAPRRSDYYNSRRASFGQNHGDVAKSGKAWVCKTPIVGSNPTVAS